MTDCDVMVLPETWLKQSITNNMIHIDGYNVFSADRVNKGGGVAIYTKTSLNVSSVESITKPKFFKLSAVKLHLPSGADLTVVGCYRPPSAVHEAVSLLSVLLLKLSDKELFLFGDLNWDWLSTSSSMLHADTLHLTQLINSPTRLNTKHMDKSTLPGVILTNCPHKYSATGIFCNDVSDHCALACVRNCNPLKTKPTNRFIFKRNYKRFDEQAFLRDIPDSDLILMYEMPDV